MRLGAWGVNRLGVRKRGMVIISTKDSTKKIEPDAWISQTKNQQSPHVNLDHCRNTTQIFTALEIYPKYSSNEQQKCKKGSVKIKSWRDHGVTGRGGGQIILCEIVTLWLLLPPKKTNDTNILKGVRRANYEHVPFKGVALICESSRKTFNGPFVELWITKNGCITQQKKFFYLWVACIASMQLETPDCSFTFQKEDCVKKKWNGIGDDVFFCFFIKTCFFGGETGEKTFFLEMEMELEIFFLKTKNWPVIFFQKNPILIHRILS